MSTPASEPLPLDQQLRQLNEARKLVLSDISYYPTIVQGILPIIGPAALPELRRWGAEFLAEAFATPALPGRDKESLSLLVLETIKSMLDSPKEDVFVQRSAVMSASSVYPLVLRWIINNDYDAPTWERLSAIKSSILRIWEDAVPATKICCIKFAQRVVMAQTVAIESQAQPKRDGLDVSLSSIPANHRLLDPRQLEAEATGLLDRMLTVLQENSSDALIVDATLNTLSVLVQTRPATSARIVNSILSFNPLKLANAPMSPKTRVLVQSMEKTTRLLLIHIAKRDAQGVFAPRIQQYVERIVRSRSEIFEVSSRKRAPGDAQAGAFGDAKRRRLEPDGLAAEQLQPTPLGPGPHSLAAVYTMTTDVALRSFDASLLPEPLVTHMAVGLLARLDTTSLARSIEAVRTRLAALESSATQPALLNPDTAPLGVEEDDDDYEPDFYAAEDTEQILNKLDSDAPPEPGVRNETSALALGGFILPPPPSLGPGAAPAVGRALVSRVFGPLQTFDSLPTKKTQFGLNRLAADSWDREAWLTIIIRLGTRSSSGLEDADEPAEVKSELALSPAPTRSSAMSDAIRELLYVYILENFRSRIDVSVAWLCEEWYGDQLVLRQARDPVKAEGRDPPANPILHYETWALRLVDGFLPYLTPQDKVLTRFLGEIPELSPALLDRVKSLCGNPDMVNLALTSLLYLVMMRPPVRDLALDRVAAIWQEFEYARTTAAKYLVKWRPGFLESQTDGVAPPKASPSPVAVSS